jgi:hypothetical protein
MSGEYVSKATSIHDEVVAALQSDCDWEKRKEIVIGEYDAYLKLIPEFFSSHGEAAGIKDMYKKLKELDRFRDRIISAIDITRIGNIYVEYYTGMCDFVDEVIENAESSNGISNDLIEALDLAKKGDPQFVDSLFGGKNGERVDTRLTEAVANVEYLIDFIEVLKMMKLNAERFYGAAASVNQDDTVKESIKLLVSSAGTYCSRLIIEIFENYTKITDTLNNKFTTPEENSEQQELKLF